MIKLIIPGQARTPLTVKRLRELLIYDPDTGIFTRRISRKGYRKGDIAGSNHSRGYLHIGIDGEKYLSHRLAWLWMTGEWPQSEIDHINGEKRDNRFINLREVEHKTNSENEHRARKNNSSGLMGVTLHGKKWRARIKVSGKTLRLGTFDHIGDAHNAYLNAKRKLHRGCTI